MDCDQLAAQQKMAQGVAIDENGQALDAIREVGLGEGSHYLGAAHTQANFQTAFFRSEIADNNSFEQWEAEGAKSAPERAREKAEQWINQHEAPAMDPAVREALDEFVAVKKNSMPDAFT
jgi:trimethylamine--corrinoid protein Co-methyltransferase